MWSLSINDGIGLVAILLRVDGIELESLWFMDAWSKWHGARILMLHGMHGKKDLILEECDPYDSWEKLME